MTRDESTFSYGSGDIIRIYRSRVISWGLDPDRPGMKGRTIDAFQANGRH